MQKFMVTFFLLSADFLPMHSFTEANAPNICGSNEEITLTDAGADSFQIIDLDPGDTHRSTLCTLRIKAPPSHLVHLRFQETNLEIHRLMSKHDRHNHQPCNLDIYLQDFEDRPVWKGDLCTIKSLPDVDLLTPQIKLMWDPADDSFHAKGRKIMITSVGKDAVCKQPDQHVCMRIGWQPSLCVSSHLLCDGREDCPRGSTTSDEDETFCKSYLKSQTSWHKLAENLLRKLQPSTDVNKLLEQLERAKELSTTESSNTGAKKTVRWKDWKELNRMEVSTKAPNNAPPKTLLGFIISQYGPWGYLLLGLLLCGTTLVSWGLWECTRKRKAELDALAAAQLNSPTTAVLMVNGYEDAQSAQPPEYEDLDLPPSYAVLFPHEDKSTDSDEDDDDDRGETIALDSISSREGSGGQSSREGR